jgi:hypothetical protein
MVLCVFVDVLYRDSTKGIAHRADLTSRGPFLMMPRGPLEARFTITTM